MSRQTETIRVNWTGSCDGSPAAQAKFDFEYLGRRVTGVLFVESERVSLACLVPAARELADKFADIAAAHAASCGRKVSCRKGCTACCSYLLPLSAPEAMQLAGDIAEFSPQQRDELLRRFDGVCGRIFASARPKSSTAESLGEWYAGLQASCPFQVDGLCSIYEQRPLACREWMLSSSTADCNGHQPGKGDLVPVLSMTEALGRVTAELEGDDIDAVILPLALDWALENRARAEKTYPAQAVLNCLVSVISRSAAEYSSVAAA